MIKTIKILCTISLLSTISFVSASPLTDLKDCTSIERDLKRLSCFDKKIKQLDTTVEMVVEQVPSNTVVAPISTITPNQSDKQENRFGLEDEEQAKVEEVHSSIAGEFRGWTGKTIFKLTNGQVWKQIGSGKVTTKKMDPKVTIKKGFMGNFRLKIEGLNTRVSVKRIK